MAGFCRLYAEATGDYVCLSFIRKLKKVTDPPGFEPGPEAPEASILSRLYYESTSPESRGMNIGDIRVYR